MQKRLDSTCRLKYRHYNLPVDFPIIAFLGDNWVLPTDDSYLHFHNCLEIGYCHSGAGSLNVENKSFTFKEGDISFIPQNAIHKGKSLESACSRWEYILADTSHLLDLIGAEIPGSDKLLYDSPEYSNIIKSSNCLTIQSLVQRILLEFHHKKDHYEMNINGLYIALIIELIRMLPQNPEMNSADIKSRHAILPAIIHINNHFNKEIVIQDLSDLCHLSITHFRRIFKSIMNTSPLDYINHLRIRKSCALLYDNSQPILAISKKVGFTTLSSFNRHFHMFMGISPSQWRKISLLDPHENEIYSLEDSFSPVFKL